MVQLADTKNKELAHVIQLLKHKKITPLAFQQGAYFAEFTIQVQQKKKYSSTRI
ncbi:hypothetical protein [Glaesserella parasuis]|uniref:hypothetical protein n=1 Tax=Glaesserella parasuis TaxID=738 RepID=UPI001365FCBD|nr:hypothetical protein [Glaesserella parasuis]MDO9664467.1 hypothetical protein [Glaesserella parasuis]